MITLHHAIEGSPPFRPRLVAGLFHQKGALSSVEDGYQTVVSTVCVYSVVPWSDCSDATVLFCAFVRRGQFLKYSQQIFFPMTVISVQHAAVRRQSRSLIGLGRDKSEVCKVRYPTRDGTMILY